MTRSTQTFSESWHSVAEIRATLKKTVRVHKQRFRGDWWYVLGDPFSNRFFRVQPDTYLFLNSLNLDQTIDQVWQARLSEEPDNTPGQQEVIDLLAQLHQNSLLQYSSATDSQTVFQRQQQRKKQELRAKLLSFMFIKIPLLDPDAALKKAGPFFSPLFSKAGAFLWFAIVALGLKAIADNADSFLDQSNGLLAPSNLVLLYLSMALVKTLHELGHAIVCRHYSGEVHTLGVMLIILIPLPYMDATSSWAFKRPWQRIFVGGAGMIVELWIAAIAAVVWANTGSGVINSLAYNIIFIASVSTLLFNGNPLLRFDAYYMLSDALDIPNLYQRSRKQVVYLIERFVFRCQQLTSEAYSLKEAWYLVIYAILSTVYRVVILVGIIFFVADKYLILGLIMALFSLFMWAVPPPVKLIQYLMHNPRIARRRQQAKWITTGFVLTLVLVFGLIPAPHNVRVPGVIEATNFLLMNTQANGYLKEILVHDNEPVSEDTPLLVFENKDLERELKTAQLQLLENEYQQEKARVGSHADLAPLLVKHEFLEKRLAKLQEDKDSLVFKAPFDGVWSAPEISERVDTWIEKGTTLGTLYDVDAYRFSAIMQQDDGLVFQRHNDTPAEVRIQGQEGHNITASELEIFPFENERLPSAALGWLGGGSVAVKADDETGTRTTEPFFQIYAALPDETNIDYFHGVSGTLRLNLTPEPLFWQWYRQIRQVVQRRYQI
ncbi:site-2 protease family protein [Parendozoicomonas sp. Alg238-R29]|uniref:site-2 protease family protein n=1 Tax=Parendozoicomonas sp. Alg238-R29 TaxID=2993446 RepID=UPI00248E170D|nr:site-2 protease family protein [Parendozoicomonas sp. Alg238-R29]